MFRSRLKRITLLPLLLAGVTLRALVPAGYMPAAAGSGLLFELCHERLPAGFMAALAVDDAHAHHSAHHPAHHSAHHHGSHDQHDEHGEGVGDCSMGHLLLLAAIDTVEPAGLPEFGWASTPIDRSAAAFSPRRSHATSPRGPPAA